MSRSIDYLCRLTGWHNLAVELIGSCVALADAHESGDDIEPFVGQISRTIFKIRALPKTAERNAMQRLHRYLEVRSDVAKQQSDDT